MSKLAVLEFKLPTSCKDCPLFLENNKNETWCCFTDNLLSLEAVEIARPKNCPLRVKQHYTKELDPSYKQCAKTVIM